jgi:hypothetical protein
LIRSRGKAPVRRRLRRAAAPCAALALILLLPACASRPPRQASTTPAPARGYRALFRGEAEGPRGKDRFRLAVALLPPARMRLEFYGPAGGARAVLSSDGTEALLALPRGREYETLPATAAGFRTLLGLPIDAADIVALLTGRPFCPPEDLEQQVRTRPAAAFGRTLDWFEVACPPNDVRYRAVAAERGGTLREATLRETVGGAMILRVEYDDHDEGLGPRWPRRLRLALPREEASVTLLAVEGPAAGDVPDALFAITPPPGFARRPLRLSLSAPGFAGPVADQER